MKRLSILLLMVLAFAAVSNAAVTISAVPNGTTVAITYSGAGTTADTAVRAFALDVSVTGGPTISAVSCLSASGYYIYPGSIQISGGSVTSAGSCICSSTYPGTLAGTVPGGTAITLEMGSLYTGTTKPAASGTIATVTLSAATPGSVFTIAANTARGGVVFENPDSTTPVTFINIPTPCYTGTHPDQWAIVGSPTCWCKNYRPRQCHGDADGTKETKSNYWVSTNDLAVLVAAWNRTLAQLQLLGQVGNPPTLPICADFTQTPETKQNYRVSAGDLAILIANWNKGNLPLADCP